MTEPTPEPTPTPTPTPADPPPAEPKPTEWDGKIESLPDGVQKIIADLRNENASSRTQAKEQAAKEAEKAILDKLLAAFGKTPEGGDQPPTVEELTKQLTETTTTSETNAADAKAARVELALFKASIKHDADPDLLTAVLAHKGKLGDLDPSADNFTESLDELVKKAVEENPKLKATPAAGSSSADHGGPAGGAPKQTKTLEDAISDKLGA